MESNESIVREITNYLQNGNVFEHILRRNPKLYLSELKQLFTNEIDPDLDVENLLYTIECNEAYLTFKGKPIVRVLENSNCYKTLFISDFNYNGFIYNNAKKLKLTINATVMICTRKPIPPNNEKADWYVRPEPINATSEYIDVMDKSSYEVWKMEDKDRKVEQIFSNLKKNNITE